MLKKCPRTEKIMMNFCRVQTRQQVPRTEWKAPQTTKRADTKGRSPLYSVLILVVVPVMTVVCSTKIKMTQHTTQHSMYIS